MDHSAREEKKAFDPHAGQSVLSAGPAPENAAATIVMLHGRGASASSILRLHGELGLPAVAAIAPQAAGNSWYPYSFLSPLQENQPYLDSALSRVESLVGDLVERGIATENIVLLGFSQGACLTCEFAARHARSYGAVIGLTGGLIGPPGAPRNYKGSLAPTPVFLGTSDPDPHVPFGRVQETEAILGALGARVELRRYPGLPHTVNQDEIDAVRALVTRVTLGRPD